MKKDEAIIIPKTINYDSLSGLSNEIKFKLKKIRPNIIFKGDDYSIDEVVGSKVIKNWGGKIKLIKCVKGKSTSSIIRKIKNVT